MYGKKFANSSVAEDEADILEQSNIKKKNILEGKKRKQKGLIQKTCTYLVRIIISIIICQISKEISLN